MDYPDTFAGLSLAIVEAGVDPEFLPQLEEQGVRSVSGAMGALMSSRLPPELSTAIQAALVFALGPERVPDAARQAAVEAPPTKVRRTDLHVARPSRAGSLSKALASACPAARQETLNRFNRDLWAPSNQKPQQARWKTWSKVCEAWGIPALPLTVDGVEKVSASLKEGGYRSARQYFASARREHVLQMKAEVPPEVLLKMRGAIRSIERGLGGPALKDGFRVEDLVLPLPSDQVPTAKRQAVTVVILGCWFLMREIEIAAVRNKHFTVDVERQEVAFTLASSKTDQQGNLVQRKHQCYCSYVPAHLCPFHTALAFEKIRPKNPEAPLFVSAHGDELTKQESIALIRKVLADSHVALRRAGAPGQSSVERFGGHVLRVSGAQFLARRFVPLPTVMLLGRWGSRSVERYVQEAALECSIFGDEQAAMGRPVGMLSKPAKRDGGSGTAKDQAAEFVKQLEILSAQIEALQARPLLVVGKRAHARDPHELDKLPIQWTTACGCWRYGCAAFVRAGEDHPAVRCRRCFPTCAPDASDNSESENSASATSSESSSSGSKSEG